jgi:hypothetical protein
MQLLLQINIMQVVEPNCQTASPRSSKDYLQRRYLEENFDESLLSQTEPASWCRVINLSSLLFSSICFGVKKDILHRNKQNFRLHDFHPEKSEN